MGQHDTSLWEYQEPCTRLTLESVLELHTYQLTHQEGSVSIASYAVNHVELGNLKQSSYPGSIPHCEEHFSLNYQVRRLSLQVMPSPQFS